MRHRIEAFVEGRKRHWTGCGWSSEKQNAQTGTYNEMMHKMARMRKDGITAMVKQED